MKARLVMRSVILFLLLFCCQDETAVAVTSDDGTGQGVLVDRWTDDEGRSLGLIVTAAHVVAAQEVATVTYINGRASKNCYVTAIDRDNDLAILVAWVPDGIEPASIRVDESFTAAESFRVPIRLAIRDRGFAYYDACPKRGDSGSGLFVDHQLVGVVSGGWFWLESKSSYTWPLRAARGSRVMALLQTVDKQKLIRAN